jgi:putative hydrolase of the HAD superfamily
LPGDGGKSVLNDAEVVREFLPMLGHVDGIVFDAVGTIIIPRQDVARVYADAGFRFGIAADPDALRLRFRRAFQQEEAVDEQHGWAVDEARERARWQAIVQTALPGAPEQCFEYLFDYYATPEAWQVVPGAVELLESLTARGLLLGLASNFDARLERIAAALPGLQAVARRLVISSRVGVRKPHPKFFQAAADRLGAAASRLAYLGDDPRNDFFGAQQAGWLAILYDPQDRYPAIQPRIRQFAELLQAELPLPMHLSGDRESTMD